jgi:hypothetical protein
VAGTAALGLNGLVLTFTPETELQANATYTMSIDGVRDLAGNLADDLPFVSTFDTLDTIGPDIALLRIADDKSPIAGTTAQIEAVLVEDEPGASVRFTQDFTPIGVANESPYRVDVRLPEPTTDNPQPPSAPLPRTGSTTTVPSPNW